MDDFIFIMCLILPLSFNKRDKTDRQDVCDLDLAGLLFFQYLQ